MNSLHHNLEHHFALPEVAEVPLLRPLDWISAGWQDVRRCPGVSLSYGLAITALLALVLAIGADRPYLFVATVSGFLLVGPILAVGLYEISRRLDAGESPTLGDAFAGWRRNSSSIGAFGMVLAIVAIGWERVSAIMFALLYGGHVPDLARFVNEVLLSGDYARMMTVYMLAGAVLAALVFAISAISLPLMMDRNTDMATALMASFEAVTTNPAPMALWATLIVFFVGVGFATSLIGMIFVMPLLGHATWHAYKGLIK